jgi:hypothetical protein
MAMIPMKTCFTRGIRKTKKPMNPAELPTVEGNEVLVGEVREYLAMGRNALRRSRLAAFLTLSSADGIDVSARFSPAAPR